MFRAKKLVSISATFLSVIEVSKKKNLFLEWMPCIYYLLRFYKDTVGVRALIDWGIEVNAMSPMYASKLGLKVHHTDVETQKIDGSTVETFEIVLTSFQVKDKLRRI